MIKKIARWILTKELLDEYLKGWHDGVEQHMHEPESCHPIYRPQWLTLRQYTGIDEI